MSYNRIPITVQIPSKAQVDPTTLLGVAVSQRPQIVAEEMSVLAVSFIKPDGSEYPLHANDTFEIGCDTNYVHFSKEDALSGALTAETTITSIVSKSQLSVMATGHLVLTNSIGETERVAYTSYNAQTRTFAIPSYPLLYSYVDGDSLDIEDELMFYSDNEQVDVPGDWDEIDRTKGKISIRIDAGADVFKTKLNSKMSATVHLELRRYPLGGTTPAVMYRDDATAYNTVINGRGRPGTTSLQYLTPTSADARYATILGVSESVATHNISIDAHSDIRTALAAKADSSHTHASTDISGLGDAVLLSVGTTSDTVAAGNDSRFGDAITIQGRAVASTAPTDGQALVWDNTASTWKPVTIATGGVSAGDVSTAISTHDSATDSHSDLRTAISGKANSTHTHASTDISGLGGAATLSVGTTSGTVAAGNDSRFGNAVTLQSRNLASTAPTDGQAIVWDNANSTWKPATISSSGGSMDGYPLASSLTSADAGKALIASVNTIQLLLHLDNALTDSSPNAITATTTGTFNSSTKKFGTHSLYTTGSTYLTVASNAAVNPSTLWEMEFWYNPTSALSGEAGIWEWGTGWGSDTGAAIYYTGSVLRFIIFGNGGNGQAEIATAPTANTWNHIRVQIQGSACRIALNGVWGTDGAYTGSLKSITSGQRWGVTDSCAAKAAYIDEVVIRNSLSPAIAFTPPTDAYTISTAPSFGLSSAIPICNISATGSTLLTVSISSGAATINYPAPTEASSYIGMDGGIPSFAIDADGRIIASTISSSSISWDMVVTYAPSAIQTLSSLAYAETAGYLYTDASGNVSISTTVMTNPMTTAGDLIVGGTSGEATRLAIGTAGQYLAVNSGATGFTWTTLARPTGTASQLLANNGSNGFTNITVGTGLTLSGGTLSASGMNNPMTTAGDLIVGGASGEATRLAAAAGSSRCLVSGGSSLAWVPAFTLGSYAISFGNIGATCDHPAELAMTAWSDNGNRWTLSQLSKISTAATATELHCTGQNGTGYYTIAAGKSLICKVTVLATQKDGSSGYAAYRVGIKNVSGTVSLWKAVTTLEAWGGDIGLGTPTINLTADSVNTALGISVTPANATETLWHATIETVQNLFNY